jgi:hypothetical protein
MSDLPQKGSQSYQEAYAQFLKNWRVGQAQPAPGSINSRLGARNAAVRSQGGTGSWTIRHFPAYRWRDARAPMGPCGRS